MSVEKEKVDLIVQIPLEEEYNQFVELFPTAQNLSTEFHLTYKVKAPSGLSVVVILQDGMGRTAAASACRSAIERFECNLYVCLGIAGALSKDVNLGDVCYSGSLIDVLDNSKVQDCEGGGIDVEFIPEHYQTSRKLTASIGFVRTMTDLKPLYSFWQEDQGGFAERTLKDPVLGRKGEPELVRVPKCLNGDIVCAAVVQSKIYQDKLKGISRNLLAVETESGAVFAICSEYGIEALAIRGISDYADDGKSKLEGNSKGGVRAVAARNAAAFLHMQLQNDVFIDALRSSFSDPEAPLLINLIADTKPSLPAMLDALSLDIDRRLRELSPQYRTKPTGYRLPTPRIRPGGEIQLGMGRKQNSALEIASAISRNRRIVLHVPRTYPDPALSWILANGLLLSDVGERKVVPIVLEGTSLVPPGKGFASNSPAPLLPDISDHGGEYIFIIDSPVLSSKTRLALLVEEIRRWEDARVIVVTRDDKSFVAELDLSRSIAATPFDICDVSFSEMAIFLENSFAMPKIEADVIALKLRATFQKFSLPAHPSFFAGIPSETLSALLLANRRSELIQLAVDGFLSFIVAADKDPVRMSRTNRAQFLRQLAMKLSVEKRSFTRAQLVEFAEEISNEYDYGLNSINFIQSFEENGIIHFDDGKVKITLPFIRAYLLAVELVKDSKSAIQYFDPSDNDFDLLTFDIYSELGPAPEVVEHVRESLERTLEHLGPIGDDHILLSGEIFPEILKNPARLTNLSNRVTAARVAIEEDASDRVEKARILDIADRVNEDVSDKSDNASQAEEDGIDEDEVILQNILRLWIINAVLLGSGAESIKGNDRQKLAEIVIQGGGAILHLWTKMFHEFDFEEIKLKIGSDKDFMSELEIEDESEYKRMVSSLVDLVEFMALSNPVERVFNQLLDQARHRIISNSVSKANISSKIEELIRDIWLTDVNPKAGEHLLGQAIAELPNAPFLRVALTNLLLFRAKWKIPERRTRRALVDAAANIIKPLNPGLDKGEILRFVDRHNPAAEKLKGDSENELDV